MHIYLHLPNSPSGAMQIIQVDNALHTKDFMSLPFSIYEEDENWVPHLKQDIQKVFDPQKNKTFRHGELIRWIVRNEQGTCVGRIAAFTNDKYSSGMEQETGGLGFFESINDWSVAELLFETAIAWLRSKGMQAVDGPINFGEKNMFWGLLTENFTDMNSYGMNYNPDYYVDFFERFGFQVYYEQYCYKRSIAFDDIEKVREKASAVMNDQDYRFSDVQQLSQDELAEQFLTVYNNAWGGHHGFKAMREDQAKSVVKSLWPVIDKKIVFFVYYKNDPVAFYVAIPELNDIFKHLNGNLNWWGKLRFLYYKWRKVTSTSVGLVFGVDRKYHKRGIESAVSLWAQEAYLKQGVYTDTIMTWIGSFNPKMIRVVENLDTKRYRTLATYRYMIDPNLSFSAAPEAI